MTLLHDYFNTRNLQAFQRLLDGGTGRIQSTTSSSPSGSSYGGKSGNRSRGIIGGRNYPTCDVNATDWLGRTALHLACASMESIEYVRALLRHPHINVNLPDTESLWTPLHRALYSANLPAVLLLLQRSDTDSSLEDLEGYTAFDLYNSSLNGTKPDIGKVDAELFTWGANRNAALGVGDGNDRTFPELVVIKSKEDAATLLKSLSTRLLPIPVRHVQMSKLHTVIVTAEDEGNLRSCGFGSGGRLGNVQHTQFILKPLPSFKVTIKSVALGQDHTLAVTTSGDVYSWGLNRFSQLGYVVEVPTIGSNRHEEPIQHIPKKIVGLLKRESVHGVAASRNASACWTKDAVFTWGTNTGQLGYDKVAHPVQVLPKPVTKIKNMVIDIALSENVLAALLVTRQVECIWNGRRVRINFPMHSFPTTIQPYRPPQSVKDAIIKLTSCDETFAALSSNGEVFTFSASPAPNSDASTGDGRTAGSVSKPQRVWALRKKFSAVRDVALGSDGTIIVCTESGHVFVRNRNTKSSSNKAFQYDRIPFLQRVTQVCANSTGAFAALRVDHKPKPIVPVGNTLAQDLKMIQPYMQFYRPEVMSGVRSRRNAHDVSLFAPDDEHEDSGIKSDIEGVFDLLDLLSVELYMRRTGGGHVKYDGIRLPHDADTMVHLQSGPVFPVHHVILAARSLVLETLFTDRQPLVDTQSKLSLKCLPSKPGPGLGVPKLTCLMISGCHPLTVLIVLRYLYSDELLAIWDRRVSAAVHEELVNIGVDSTRIKSELQSFARLLNLPVLSQGLEHQVKQEPVLTMAQDMQRLFNVVQSPLPRGSPLAHDVVLQLADKEVYTHSVLLRARTSLLASFFDLEDWTVKRWGPDGTIKVNMAHLSWHAMRFVLGFLCCGLDKDMFEVLDFVSSVDDLLQIMFDIAAAANELLLDRLTLLCASIILGHCNIQNACYILEDATYYHIQPLIERMQEYIAINLDSFLQGHLLEDVPYALVKQLARFVKGRQVEKSPFSRSDGFADEMLNKHAAWLEGQDIPGTIVRTITTRPFKTAGSKLPLPPTKVARKDSFMSPTKYGDEIFCMDEQESGQLTSSKETLEVASAPNSIWKPTSAPRVDMKTIMAETQAASKNQTVVGPSRSPAFSHMSKMNDSTRLGDISPPAKPFPRSGSTGPWKINVEATVTHLPAIGTPTTPSPLVLNISGSAPTSSSTMQSQQTEPAQAQLPGLGPVITPKRQVQPKSSPSGAHSTGSGKAWAILPVQPTLKSSYTTSMSFSDIQDSQKQQATPVKDVQSLRAIQEEEQSLQLEADFLKWWTAEEERIRQEEAALALAQLESLSTRPRKVPSSKVRSPKQKQKSRAPGHNPGMGSIVGSSEADQTQRRPGDSQQTGWETRKIKAIGP